MDRPGWPPALLLILLTACFLSGNALEAAAIPATPARIRAVQEKYSALESLRFNFSQETVTAGRARTGAGDAVFIRPAPAQQASPLPPGDVIMRWNYAMPDRQVLLNDGTTLTIYTEKDNQAIRTAAADLDADLTYALFSGKRNILDDFEVLPPDDRFPPPPELDGLESAVLIPSVPHPQVQSVQVWFAADLALRRLLLVDHFDTVTDLTFSDFQFNPIPADDGAAIQELLDLKLPPATEIIAQ